MDIAYPNAQPPTPEELHDLKKLMAVLERAISDGVISQNEMKAFKTRAWADGKVTPAELQLLQEMVLSKITSGELQWDHE
ncbi:MULTISPECIES: hypothetical protein [unclassified Cyanobium]|uniref:hypothetical protein n=1 Tax=unclassified Cyanobium TaxID=2627006 RepID=UPI0020CF6DD1|nr:MULTISPECIES: hypothetical protein [unclassified Cyanobium]MCP9832799.1 hypothetical protein [Cyanobium sp. La Preciosa 7G6]MCP9935549.1 hypothetical protein [Cyanobium sp. Aljojuca 7A6]